MEGDIIHLFGEGVAPQASRPGQATVLNNMLCDKDGILRQRMGLRLIREFSDLAYLVATCYTPFVPEHRVMVVTASATQTKEYLGTRDTIGAVGFTDISAVIAAAALYGTHRPGKWTVNIPTNPAAANTIIHFAFPHNVTGLVGSDLLLGRAAAAYQQLDAAAATIKGVPFAHGYHAMAVQPGASKVRWADYAKGETWSVANSKSVPATVGQAICGQGLTNNISYIFGTHGILRLQGDTQSRFQWDEAASASAIYPGGHVVRCRDRIFYVAPGPKILSVGTEFDRIDHDIAAYFRSGILNSNSLNAFYDDLHDCFCIAGLDSAGGYLFMYSLADKRWQGAFTYDRTNLYSITMGALGAPGQKGGVTTYPVSFNPYQDQYVIASTNSASRLLVYDRTLLYDQVAGGASQNFAIGVETQSIFGSDPYADKQLLEVYVDGSGTWDILMDWRNAAAAPDFGSGASLFATVTLASSVTLPCRIAVASSVPLFKEARIAVSGVSQASAGIRSVAVRVRNMGQSYS